jgi:hypothetical protein
MSRRTRLVRVSGLALAVVVVVVSSLTANLLAKRTPPLVDPNNPTQRLFEFLDDSRAGKLADFYVIADTYADPSHPGQQLQRVLKVDYDKHRFFGRFRIYVAAVAALTPDQLKTYTPEQIFNFGTVVEKFEKINPGPFGQEGDLYLRAQGDLPPAAAPVTDDVRKEYDALVTQYIRPALEQPKSH